VAGRVTVNGAVAALGAKVDPLVDAVAVDGEAVEAPAEAVTIMLHKPAGYVTTMDDPQGRATVASLVPAEQYPGLFPVGRLDADTTGLLLFTNDGQLGNSLIHPRRHVEKTYLALVEGQPTEPQMEALRNGVLLEDGPTLPARGRVLPLSQARTVAAQLGWSLKGGRRIVELTITEGRNRQVRRMLAAVGHPVLQLHRCSLASLTLGDLAPGQWRLLADGEVAELAACAGDC